ncbi:MAG: subtilisin family serine protease [Alteromonas naphthalenivorans]|jgi:subtilisin family serine protease
MRKTHLYLLILLSFSLCNTSINRRDTRHITIEFNQKPKDDQQCLDWVEGVKGAVKSVNKDLRRDGLLIPEIHPLELKEIDSWWTCIYKYFTNLYYEVFFHQKAIAYQGQKNKAFIVRRNDSLGSFSVYIPDGIPEKHFLEVLRKMIAKHGINASIDTDQHVILSRHISQESNLGYPILQGLTFTVDSLNSCKRNADTQSLDKEDKKLLAQRESVVVNGPDIVNKSLLNGTSFYHNTQNKEHEIKKKKLVSPYLFWWQSIPTTGLRLEAPFWPLMYPFLPHAFPLWELAPKMGKGSKVFIVDTGMAAFDVIGKAEYKSNQDLQMKEDFEKLNYNLVSSDTSLLDKTEQLAQLIESHTEKSKRNFSNIKKILPLWIRTYLENKEDLEVGIALIKEYLLKNGKPGFVHKDKKQLSKYGQTALNEILYSEVGLHPKGQDAPDYTLVTLGPPNNGKKAILEFMPLVTLAKKPFNLFSTSSQQLDSRWTTLHTAGHGTHTAGIIGGLLQPSIPEALNKDTVAQLLEQDSGICGIAPQCELVMIKAFKSSGFATNRSIITQAVKKAQEQGAKILNLSLKIDDHMDIAELESQSLQEALKGIPYIAAASGNAQQDRMGGYQADREGYPARFSNVAFDAGAFVLYKDKQDEYHCHIPAFSQYQEGVGPKFVAPGQNILSCGVVPQQKESSMYIFLQGTSTAAPILSGFSALLTAEFSGLFTSGEREKFLALCYSSALRMEDSDEWQKKALLGALDFRTVLFKLHVLKNLKTILTHKIVMYTPKKEKKSKLVKLHVEQDFDRLCEAIHTVLFGMVESFAKEHDITAHFENNFMGYFNSARKVAHQHHHKELFTSLDKAIEFVTNAVLYGANKKVLSDTERTLIEKHLHQDVLKELKELFLQEKVDMLGHFTDSAKRRIKGAYGTVK